MKRLWTFLKNLFVKEYHITHYSDPTEDHMLECAIKNEKLAPKYEGYPKVVYAEDNEKSWATDPKGTRKWN